MRTTFFIIFCLLLGTYCSAQELIGRDQVSPGTLGTFEIVPAQEASWYIAAPLEDEVTYQIDTGTSRLYFASPIQGRYIVIAGIIANGKPQILVKTFFNGKEVPSPIPPESSLETWIKTQIPLHVKNQYLALEVRLIADCFEQIIRRMDENNIQTASNALTQIQITLTETLALASPTAVTDWSPFLAALSRQMEKELEGKINDFSEMKAVFQRVGNTMRSFESSTSVSLLKQNTDVPNVRKQGTRNRMFNSLFTK